MHFETAEWAAQVNRRPGRTGCLKALGVPTCPPVASQFLCRLTGLTGLPCVPWMLAQFAQTRLLRCWLFPTVPGEESICKQRGEGFEVHISPETGVQTLPLTAIPGVISVATSRTPKVAREMILDPAAAKARTLANTRIR
jgi:hypothetical protein